jgi:hypothetical protein
MLRSTQPVHPLVRALDGDSSAWGGAPREASTINCSMPHVSLDIALKQSVPVLVLPVVPLNRVNPSPRSELNSLGFGAIRLVNPV